MPLAESKETEKPWQEEERRRHPRSPVVIRVLHRLANAYQYYYTQDLSLGGMFLTTREPFAVGQDLELDFQLPGSSRRVQVEGRVVRSVSAGPDQPEAVSGMGIAFTVISEDDLAELAALREMG
jgi:uncharacterized protein (TIGR02266 family)